MNQQIFTTNHCDGQSAVLERVHDHLLVIEHVLWAKTLQEELTNHKANSFRTHSLSMVQGKLR